MLYRDLREYISQLEKDGELLRIKEEVKLEPDAGAAGAAIERSGGPGLLFENVAGCDTPLAIGLTASFRRTAIAYGLPKTASVKQLKESWLKGYDRYPVRAKTVARKDAPCKENVMLGDEVNLFRFPIPRINAQDAGPYLLKVLCTTKDPESDWINFGMYRMQVLDRNRTSIMTSHTSHWGEHYIKSRRQGKPLPMVVAIGTDPILNIVSGTKVPAKWNEFDFAGALRGAPVDIVKAETCDLPVPATAEIVVEGEVSVEADVLEGPFGEWDGAYSGMLVMPTFHVNAITYRNNPIFDTVILARGYGENAYMTLPSKVAAMELELKHILPNMTQIAFLPPIIANCVVQGRWGNRTEPRRAMNAVWASQAAQGIAKIVTVVDEDVDPWNPTEVMWAMTTRCQADKDIVMIPGVHSRLDAAVEADGTSCFLGIDATKSKEPFPRHNIANWIEVRGETEAWQEKIASMLIGGRK